MHRRVCLLYHCGCSELAIWDESWSVHCLVHKKDSLASAKVIDVYDDDDVFSGWDYLKEWVAENQSSLKPEGRVIRVHLPKKIVGQIYA